MSTRKRCSTGSRKAWWAPALELPWVVDGERLVPVEPSRAAKLPETVWITVAPQTLKLARRQARQAQKQTGLPDLTRVNTLTLDGIVATAEPARSATQRGRVGYWVKVATLTRGKPVQLPLVTNARFARELNTARDRGGRLCAAIQLHRTEHGVEVSLITDHPDARLRRTGSVVGIDFGFCSALFATSESAAAEVQALASAPAPDGVPSKSGCSG